MILTTVRDRGFASQRNVICARCTTKTMKLALAENDGCKSPYSQERPAKRQKTGDHDANDVIVAQKSPRQTVQSYNGNPIYTNGTGTPLTTTDSEKPVYTNPETPDTSNRDAQLEDIGKPSSDDIQLAQSQKTCVKAPDSAQTNGEGEQQNSDLNVLNPAEKSTYTQTTEIDGVGVFQRSSQPLSPQPSGSVEQEDLVRLRRLSQSSVRPPTIPVAERRQVKVKGSPTRGTKAGNESSDTGSILPPQKTVSKDSVVSFPLCTSCGTKRVFSTPKNGETDILW